jgi:hypothetical protein
VPGELGVHAAQLLDLVHRRLPDLALGVETGAQGPLVQQVQQRTRLLETDRRRVGKHVQRQLWLHPKVEEPSTHVPLLLHDLLEQRVAVRIRADELGLHHVDAGRHRAREQRTRARHGAVTLVLGVRGVGELLAEHVVGVGERARERRVRGDVERLEPIVIVCGIEDETECFVVVEIRAAEHVAHGTGDHLGGAGAPVHEP